jgi:hypothetical protein
LLEFVEEGILSIFFMFKKLSRDKGDMKKNPDQVSTDENYNVRNEDTVMELPAD